MTTFRLLVVEDDDQDLETCRNTIERYEHETSRHIELFECPRLEDAFKILNESFDGAIIDLKLGSDQYAGNEVIRSIEDQNLRFPVAILTGTPDAADSSFTHIGVFKKGEAEAGYDQLLNRFWRIHDTGLTRILGGRGLIENKLGQVFRKNLIPQIEQWEKYGEVDSNRTESALLRHTLNHLIQLIDDEIALSFPEEFYIYPPLTSTIHTGSIVEEKNSDRRSVVMSPDCDLVVRPNGNRNTKEILLVEVVPPVALFPWFNASSISELSKTKKGALKGALRNRKSDYYHCLPKTEFTPLGFLNFRSVRAVEEHSFGQKFKIPHKLQISPPFVKDIVSRFSSYYARQGQPDIDFERFIPS